MEDVAAVQTREHAGLTEYRTAHELVRSFGKLRNADIRDHRGIHSDQRPLVAVLDRLAEPARLRGAVAARLLFFSNEVSNVQVKIP
jgi:hypothetical protein